MLSTQSNVFKKSLVVVCALLVALACYIFLFFRVEELNYDAAVYYHLSQTFLGSDGSFSLANYSGEIRGVLYALLLFVFDKFSKLTGADLRHIVLTVNFIMLLACAATFSKVFFPHSFFTKSKEKLYFGLALVLIIFTVLARFVFTTVLTDFPAFSLCLLGILLCLFATDSSLSVKTALAVLFGGALLYGAYNFRTIYMFSALVMLCFFVVRFFRSREKGRTLLIALIFVLGMGLASIPQIVVNYYQYSAISPMVITAYDNEGASLFMYQLFWGFDTCRYDTYIGQAIKGVDVQYSFHWAPGQLFLNSFTGERRFETALVILEYPLTYVALYINHLLNMLSPYFTEVFVKDLNAVKWPYLFSMFALCYFVVWDIMAKIRSREYNLRSVLDRRCLPIFAIMAPGLAIVPGAVEYRFGIPLLWLLFTYFVFQCSWKQRLGDIKKEPLRFAICFLGLLGVMLVFWSETLASGPIPLGF